MERKMFNFDLREATSVEDVKNLVVYQLKRFYGLLVVDSEDEAMWELCKIHDRYLHADQISDDTAFDKDLTLGCSYVWKRGRFNDMEMVEEHSVDCDEDERVFVNVYIREFRSVYNNEDCVYTVSVSEA